MPETIAMGGKIIHIDIDINELQCSRLQNKININLDVESTLNLLNKYDFTLEIQKWNTYLNTLKSKYSQKNEIARSIVDDAPYRIMEILNNNAENNAIYCTDVGQHQMWAMQMLRLKQDQQFYTSGGLGAMGCCLPISIGIAFASHFKRNIYAICGDGGFHMSTQSLMLITQYNLPIKIIIINNKSLGMITQFQELYFNNITVGTNASGGYLVPDFSYMAKSYGLKYLSYDATNSIDENSYVFKDFFNSRNCILEYIISENCKVFPKLEYNQPIYNPSPSIKDVELKKDMYIKLINDNLLNLEEGEDHE